MNATINLFTGWLGFGSALAQGILSEPSDASYARRSIIFGPLYNGIAQDVLPGTIGPATTAWAPLLFAGLFDAATGGDLLATWSLPRPIALLPGQTWTSQGAFTLSLDGYAGSSPLTPRSWVSGTRIGAIRSGTTVTAMTNLQLVGGQLSAANSAAASPITVGNLPSTAPATGSGQLWNNGGVICIA